MVKTKVVPFTTKLDTKQLASLRAISEKTHIPQAALVRQGIDWVIRSAKEDLIDLPFRRVVSETIREELPLLKKLARM